MDNNGSRRVETLASSRRVGDWLTDHETYRASVVAQLPTLEAVRMDWMASAWAAVGMVVVPMLSLI